MKKVENNKRRLWQKIQGKMSLFTGDSRAACCGTPYPCPVTGRKTKQTHQTHFSENKFCDGEHLSTDTLEKKRKKEKAETGN